MSCAIHSSKWLQRAHQCRFLWSRWQNDKAIHVASVWFLRRLTRLKVVRHSFIGAITGLFVSPGCHYTWPRQSGCDWQMPGEIRSSELRWAPVALNTPSQLSDVDHEMGQTFQMRKQLSLISHYECRLLRVSGFSSCCSWLCLARQCWRGRRPAKDIPLKPREEPRRETHNAPYHLQPTHCRPCWKSSPEWELSQIGLFAIERGICAVKAGLITTAFNLSHWRQLLLKPANWLWLCLKNTDSSYQKWAYCFACQPVLAHVLSSNLLTNRNKR